MKILIGAVIVLLVIIAVFVVGFRVKWGAEQRQPFAMRIDDRFALVTDGKVVVVGVVSSGEVQPGDSLEIHSAKSTLPVRVEALEAYGHPLTRAGAGDRVGIMLVGASKNDIALGDLLRSVER